MNLQTEVFVEDRAVGEPFGAYGNSLRPTCVLPGACTSCNGSSSTSCCSSMEAMQRVINPVRTFDQAARVFNVAIAKPLSGVPTNTPISGVSTRTTNE